MAETYEETKKRRDKISPGIMAADIRNTAIPIEVEEFEMPDTKDGKVWLALLREEFTGLKSVLFGQDGNGGFLPDIKESLAFIKTGQRQLEEQITTLTTQSIRDRADLEAKITEVKNDTDAIGGIARDARDSIKSHCQDMEKREAEERGFKETGRRFKWELIVAISAVIVGLAGVLFGVLK